MALNAHFKTMLVENRLLTCHAFGMCARFKKRSRVIITIWPQYTCKRMVARVSRCQHGSSESYYARGQLATRSSHRPSRR